jgi:hypothetical protein
VTKPQQVDPFWKWLVLTIFAAILIVGIQDRVSGPPINNDPYTGLCERASAQQSC